MNLELLQNKSHCEIQTFPVPGSCVTYTSSFLSALCLCVPCSRALMCTGSPCSRRWAATTLWRRWNTLGSGLGAVAWYVSIYLQGQTPWAQCMFRCGNPCTHKTDLYLFIRCIKTNAPLLPRVFFLTS